VRGLGKATEYFNNGNKVGHGHPEYLIKYELGSGIFQDEANDLWDWFYLS
jgi:hypothetical protein